jgi:choline kinase
MKGVVLAAGRGSRLGSATAAVPKPLVPVGGQRCIDYALNALARVCESILVVTGYEAEQVEAHVASVRLGIPVRTCCNRDLEAGNLTSLLAGRAAIGQAGFILTNADHLFPADMYSRHFQPGDGIRIATERSRPILDDEMKVAARDDRLVRISKTLEHYDGAYIGTTIVPSIHAHAYWRAFDRVHAREDLRTASVEMVLGELAASGNTVPELCWIEGLRWYEVDTQEDLGIARAGLDQ